MNLILKKLRPMIVGNPVAFVMLVLVSMLGMSVLIGILGGYQILKADFDQYYDEYGYPDITLTFSAAPRIQLPDLLEVDGVQSAGFRLVLDAQIERQDGRLITGRITGLPGSDATAYQTLDAAENRDATDLVSIYMSPKFIEHNNLHVGDTLQLRDLKGDYREVYLEKSITAPEFLYVMRNPFSWHDDTDFGYSFMDLEEMQSFFGVGDAVNQCTIVLNPGANADEVLMLLEKKLEPFVVASAFTFNDSPTFKGMNAVLNPMKTMSSALPVAFFGAAMLITYMFLSQFILRQREQIGILRALGFSRGDLLALYCSYSLFITFMASLIGGIVGTVLARYSAGINRDFFYLPDYGHFVNPWLLVLATILTIASGILPTWISCYKIAGINPSIAMRGEPPATHKTPYLVRTIFRNLPELPKLIISLTLRNKKRLFLSVISMGVSTILIIIALTFTLSKNYILDNYYSERNQFHSQTFFLQSMPKDIAKEWEDWDEVDRCEPIITGIIKLEHGDVTKEVLLYGLSPESTLIQLEDPNRIPLAIGSEGIVLEQNTAEILGVAIGDWIQAITRDGNGENRSIPVEVAAIAMESVNYIQYSSLEQAQKILSGGESSGSSVNQINSVVATLSVEDEIDFHQKLSELSYVDYSFFVGPQKLSASKTIAQMDIPAYIINVFAILLGFVVIYNSSRISYFERRKQFASLRAFGFRTSEIVRNTFIEAGVQFILAMAIGLPAGHWMSKVFLGQIRSDVMSYPFVNNGSTYAIALGLVFLFTVVGHAMAVSSIGKLNLTETLKDRNE